MDMIYTLFYDKRQSLDASTTFTNVSQYSPDMFLITLIGFTNHKYATLCPYHFIKFKLLIFLRLSSTSLWVFIFHQNPVYAPGQAFYRLAFNPSYYTKHGLEGITLFPISEMFYKQFLSSLINFNFNVPCFNLSLF